MRQASCWIGRGIGIAALALASLAPALAETRDLGSFGRWGVYGGTSVTGQQLCGIRTAWPDGRAFHIKYFADSSSFTIQLFKTSWNVTARAPVQMNVRLGSNAARIYDGFAFPGAPGSGGMVELSIPVREAEWFWSAFRLSVDGKLGFVTGNEPAWLVNLEGTNAAADAMVGCINGLRPATQPFASAPSQPFVRPPASGTDVTTPAPRSGGSKF